VPALVVNRTRAMKIPRFKIAIALGAFCLMVGPAYLLWDRDPCARLERMAKSAARLEAVYPRPYRLSDHIVGILHRSEPMRYYEEAVAKEQKALLASGHLVETQIRIPADRSAREVHKALYSAYQRTGAYYSASVDETKHHVMLLSKPQDVAGFSATLK
jgi:hypothetical protein